MSMKTLQDLYQDHIQDLYSAEEQIIEALPKMIDKASHPKLRDAFSHHLEQTRQHAQRLEQIAKRMDIDVDDKKCKGMEGVLKEGDEILKAHGDSAVIDAALISAAQRVEHYEMAGYGCARTYATALGFTSDASMLQRTLDEEGETDQTLTRIAESVVNPDAQQEIPVSRESMPHSQQERHVGQSNQEIRP